MVVRLIQVGLGGWGTNWLEEAVPLVPGAEVVAVVDAVPAALERVQEKLSLPPEQCHRTLTDALRSTDADAVLVTAPLVAHLPLAIEAMKAGRHVLVEKPFAPTVAAAREAVEFAEQRGLVLAVSQNYRYYPAPRTVRTVLASGELGRLGTVRVDFRKWANQKPERPSKHHMLPHALLYDMSIHHFDLMRLVLRQEPVEVFAKVTDPPYSRFTDEAAATLVLTFSGGTTVSYRGSWASSGPPTPWSGEWHLECERGEIAWSGPERLGAPAGAPEGADVVRLRRLPETREEASPYVDVPLEDVPYRGRAGTLAAFVDAITHGGRPETSGRDNLPTLAVCEAAVRSAASGTPVTIQSVMDA
ncbi:MAG TPA: Gfo/Idh/MocA family oxidoreductase [Actinopolymorphaceae bacterium]